MISLIFSVIIYDSVTIAKRSHVRLSDEPVLSGGATTSVTQTPFTITGVYCSKDKTQAMIVLSGDLSAVSYVADTYKAYLVGKSAKTYSGGIYAFADLNLLCVYVTNINGFDTEQTTLVLQCSASANADTADQTDDMTFGVNLGAKNIQTVSFMDDSGLNIELMAKSAFFHDEDAEIRTTLTDLQAQMVSARSSLSNIRQNIDRIGIELPVAPEWMLYKSTEKGKEIDGIDQIDHRENTGSEFIRTSYVFPGAADFDWENTSRLDDYAKAANVKASDLKTTNDSTDEDVSTDTSTDQFVRPNVDDAIPQDWYKKDGSVITTPSQSESALIEKYSEAINNYYATKEAYQDTVASLIVAQNKYINAITDYTSNVGDGAVIGTTGK